MFSNLNFEQGVNSNGIGLGLSLCKKIISSLKGDLVCNSQENKGTKITFRIPVS